MKYKLRRKEAFDFVVHGGDYEKNRQEFLRSVSEHPDYYAFWEEVSNQPRGFHYYVWKEIDVENIEKAKDEAIKNNLCQEIVDELGNILVDEVTLHNYKNLK